MAIDTTNPRYRKPGDLLREYQTGEPRQEQNPVEVSLPKDTPSLSSYLRSFTPNNIVAEDNTKAALQAGFGTSIYDSDFTPGEDIEQRRAIEQSGASKIINGALKGGVTAATTAVNTVAGTLYGAGVGLGTFAKNIVEGNDQPFRSAVDAGVNNAISNTMMDIQKLSEDWFPNYRTQEERSDEYQRQWIKHIFTPNFIGDSFLKNFGFTVGAMAGGAVWSSALGAAGRAKLAGDLMKGVTAAAKGDAAAAASLEEAIAAIRAGNATRVQLDLLKNNIQGAARRLNKLSAQQMLIGATISAMGEGVTEGVMARNEFIEGFNEKWQDAYREEYEQIEKDVLNEADSAYVDIQHYIFPDGTEQEVPVLTPLGENEVLRRRMELEKDYNRQYDYALKQADRLATTTFALNLPLLTVSNTIQFGRMFSGGWKTARNTARAVNGNIGVDATGKVVSDVTGKGNVWSKAIGKSLKVGTSEASEEMLQGFVSSGSKNVADSRLTAYNDDGYDTGVAQDYADWVSSMVEGGKEYLSDWKNWQEGFMGMITGLIGMPGSGYFSGQRGGVFQAINEASDEVSRSHELAEQLNSVVNSAEFQKRWHGYARHNLYEKQMADAIKKNDEYTWRTANDKQLINDIMMFADSGRLDDLYQLVDTYAGMSDEEAKAAGIIDVVKSKDTENDIDNNPEKTLATVKKHANEFKAMINDFRETYDDLRTVMPTDVSDAHLQELAFTTMQIKRFEQRYFSTLADVLKEIAPQIMKGANTTDEQEQVRVLEDQLSKYNRLFSELSLPSEADPTASTEATKAMKWLETKAKSVKGLTAKVKDLKKLSQNRRDFYSKFSELRSITSEEYQEEAETQEKKTQEVRQENLKREFSGYNSVDDVRTALRSIPASDTEARATFMSDLRKMRGKNPYVTSFLDLNKLYEDFVTVYNRNTERPDPNSPVGVASKYIVDMMFDSASSINEVYNDPENLLPARASMKNYLRGVFGNAYDDSRLEDSVDDAIDIVRGVIGKLSEINDYHTPSDYKASPFDSDLRSEVSSEPEDDRGDPFDIRDDTRRRPKPSTQQSQKSSDPFDLGRRKKPSAGKMSTGVYSDALGRKWSKGQDVYLYKIDEEDGVIDTSTGEEYTISSISKDGEHYVARLAKKDSSSRSRILVYLDDDSVVRMQPSRIEGSTSREKTPGEPVAVKKDERASLGQDFVASVYDAGAPDYADDTYDEDVEQTGVGVLDYYHQSMPEIDSYQTKDARDISHDPSLSDDEKAKRIAKKDLRDFNVVNPAFNEMWNAQAAWRGQNSFDNVANSAHAGDKVKFVIDPKFPKYKDKPQILVMLDKGGNGNDLLLTVLHSDDKTGMYSGLRELRERIYAQHEGWTPQNDDDLFVFAKESGEPYTSEIYLIRNGFVVYGDMNSESPIKNKPGFDKDAPIFYVGKQNNLAVLHNSRSNYDTAQLAKLVDKLYSKGDKYNPTGNLYYLAKDSRGIYSIPVRLGVEHYNRETRLWSNDTFNTINSRIKGIAESLASTTIDSDESLASARADLSDKVKTLSNSLDVHELVFHIVVDEDTNIPTLIIYRNGNKTRSARKRLSEVTEEWLSKTLASADLSVNISNSSNISKLIDDEVLTSNATAMRPKGTDFCFYHWDESEMDFVGTEKQKAVKRQEIGQPEGTVEEVDDKPVKPEDVKLAFSEPSENTDKRDDDRKDEEVQKVINEKRDDSANSSIYNESMRIWENVPDTNRANLSAQGWTKDLWESDDVSDEDRKQALGCS